MSYDDLEWQREGLKWRASASVHFGGCLHSFSIFSSFFFSLLLGVGVGAGGGGGGGIKLCQQANKEDKRNKACRSVCKGVV